MANMDLETIDDNPQVQRLTIALKNICRDYPAGGTVLRELLQNADDAGATVVRFVLDDRNHPMEELIHPHLRQHQGPALLAYNNAIFTPKDYKNLSNLGNSLKIQDGLTTGKFGRGFNSVYNWTDSQSIVSRERLLILDPHCRWSGGGPVYDFVQNSGNTAIKNQMAAYQSVMENQEQSLDGTIIRIPLRSKAQAIKSEICSRETTTSAVLEVLQNFAAEFGNSGLLFMRSIERVGIESTAGMSIEINIVDREKVKVQRSKINTALEHALRMPDYTFNHSFQVEIEHRTTQELRRSEYVIHHSIQGVPMDDRLREWTNEQKLIPWIAIAAQVPHPENFQGVLFAVLPLPIATNQPVHIHGLFSISPDRARLYQFSDTSIQDRAPAMWNNSLFQGPVPIAWTKLLIHLAHIYPHRSAFEFWPQSLNNPHDPLSNAVQNIITIIDRDSLPLFPTGVGYKTASSAILDTGNESIALRDALKEAQVPIVYVPEYLRHRVKHLFKNRILSARVLCEFLTRESNRVRAWTIATKQKILEYILSEPGFTEYGALELFPFEDGEYRSIANHSAFVHRNAFEKSLFHLESCRNIDLDKVSASSKRALKEGCRTSILHPSIQYRSVAHFRDYCLNNVFNKVPISQDMVELDEEAAAFVSKGWTWITEKGVRLLDDHIAGLWLLPLTNDRFRKIKPQSSSSEIIIAQDGEMADLLKRFDAKSSSKAPPLLNIGLTGVSPHVLKLIKEAARLKSKLQIKDAENLVHLAQWLNKNAKLVAAASDKEKNLVMEHMAMKLSYLHHSDLMAVGNALRPLNIFKEVSWREEGDNMVAGTVWAHLNSSRTPIGILDGVIPTPEITHIQFLDAPWSGYARSVLETLQLAVCKGTVDIIESYIIPAWKSSAARKWPYSVKEQAASLLLRQYSCLCFDSQIELRALPMVPVATVNGKITSKFAAAENLVDPSATELIDLFFDEDEVFPVSTFFRQFHVALKGCGLKTAVDEDLVNRRIQCYANNNHPIEEIQQRAYCLLKSTCHWTSRAGKKEGSALQQLNWLPIDIDGLLLRAPKQCRGVADRLLVGFKMPVLGFPISGRWEKRLGWHEKVPNHILLGQLKEGVEKQDRPVIDAVLSYIDSEGETQALSDQLKEIPFTLTTTGLSMIPSKAFCRSKGFTSGCERLYPYLGNVENKFWQDHAVLLTQLEVGQGPYPGDLLDVQSTLESKVPLSEADIAVAIEVLNLASFFHRKFLAGLKVLSKDGYFCPVEDINYNDLGILIPADKSNLTHPDIPLKTIERLGIELLSERQIKGLLDIADIDDDDEFDQREQVTTRIVDTLDRYPVETTFREYLANADDTKGASKISWLLDERHHPCEKLLSPEMKTFQGPALLVYNNGVFSEDDFKGFKNVGEGIKGQDKGTIGQFGRGSQTMYHWTDVPMILSGKDLVILDPQQEVLPINQKKGRHKPGVKLSLSKLKNVCPDQLAPFEGLWGYTKELDDYPGTTFRFPLRLVKTESKLRQSKQGLDGDTIRRLMDIYFNEARISLLFLRRIYSIDFTIHGKANSGWSLSRQAPLDNDIKSFSEWVPCSYTRIVDLNCEVSGNDMWWVAIEDLEPETEHLPYSPRRLMKNVECGIAALVSSKSTSSNAGTIPPKILQPRMFSTLPLPLRSDLPVHIHATFSLSGDRQSLIVDEHGQESHGSAWNRYLLEKALPKLYLSFLEDIGTRVRQDAIRFWPQEDPPKRSCSEILCSSFWEELPNCSRRLFPKAQLGTNLSRRQPPELFDIERAIFDFLPSQYSDILVPLLLSLGLNLVRRIPEGIAKHLQRMKGVKSITGSVLRELFKSEENKFRLQEARSKNPALLEVILDLAIPTSKDLNQLDGCYFIPLEDGTLGTLKLCSSTMRKIDYFVASAKEIELFGFASGLLVSTETSWALENVLKSGKFNVEKLQLCHVKNLLAKLPSPRIFSSKTKEWLTNFWDFWNSGLESLGPSSDVSTDSFPVCLVTCDTAEMCMELSKLDKLPAVLDPSDIVHQRLCSKIPGLYRFNNKLMPNSLKGREDSFYTSASFYRFIRALRELASRSRVSFGAFARTHLERADLEILRRLLILHTPTEVDMKKRQSQEFVDAKADLRSIPFWPSCGAAPSELISANDALIAGNNHLLVPWMKGYSRFIETQFVSDHQSCLLKLDVTKVSVEGLLNHYVFPLPEMVSDLNWRYYQPLVAALSGLCASAGDLYGVQHILRHRKIVADGNRSLHEACELFDHENQIFISAFRNSEAVRFVHSNVKRFRPFWLKLGLRHQDNGLLDPTDYLQCLRTMSRRLATENLNLGPQLEGDLRVVLSPMHTPSSSLQRFGARDWLAISHEAIFLSQTNLNAEPEYRRIPMATVATDQPLLQLSDIVSHDYVAVCWSQTSFVVHEPTREVFGKVSRNGRPPTAMVWRHLGHLKEMAQYLTNEQVQSFIADLHRTYAYLQDHLDESRICFNLKNSAIWLNVSSSEGDIVSLNDIKFSWNGIQDLVLSSSCDAGPVKAVRPGLMRYENLLRALGCNSITYPTVERPKLHHGHSVSALLRTLRTQEKMIDVTYFTEGKFIKAHRVVLAAVSEKCAHQFSGRWKVEDVIRYDEDDDPDDYLSYHTLSTMINYAYEDEVNWSEMEVSDDDDEDLRSTKLNMLLDLHKGADCWLMPALKSQVEDKILVAGKKLINIENVVAIRQRAEEVQAKATENMCVSFIKKNRAAVERANSGKVL